MATQRRGVALLVEENGRYRVTRFTVTADSDQEAIRLSMGTARAVLNPAAKVVGICGSKKAETAVDGNTEKVLIEKVS